MQDQDKSPNPGSEEAVAMGCRCPVIDNRYGKGIDDNGKILFWINQECPIH